MLRFITTCVYPENLSSKELRHAQKSLEGQLIILLLSASRYHPGSIFFIFTNQKKFINSLIKKWPQLSRINIKLIPEENIIDLNHCKNHSGEHFTYAFCKLDAIHAYKKSSYFEPKTNIILSDIDAILLPKEEKSLSFFKTKNPIAISYKNELQLGSNLHKVINAINKDTSIADKRNSINDHWINSGFIVLNNKMIENIQINSKKLVDNLRENRELARTMIDHYSDEIIFCSIFKYNSGIGIPNMRNNGIANFYWTTVTKTRTLRFISFIKYPFHLHLPTSKVQRNFSKVLTSFLSSSIHLPNKIEVFILILFININGLYGRYIRPNLSYWAKKILFLS